MNPTPGTATAGNGGDFGPRQAAALLDQATAQARRTFTPGTPALWVFRAILVLVVFGGFWLSVRGQDPYSGPTGAVLPVAFALVAINIGWTGAVTAAVRRDGPAARTLLLIAVAAAAAGFGGPAGAWLIMGIGLCAVCLATAAATARQQRRSVVRP